MRTVTKEVLELPSLYEYTVWLKPTTQLIELCQIIHNNLRITDKVGSATNCHATMIQFQLALLADYSVFAEARKTCMNKFTKVFDQMDKTKGREPIKNPKLELFGRLLSRIMRTNSEVLIFCPSGRFIHLLSD